MATLSVQIESGLPYTPRRGAENDQSAALECHGGIQSDRSARLEAHCFGFAALLGEKHGSHETQLAATVLLKPSCVIRITIYLELVRQTITGELACLRKNRETAERLSAEEFDVTAASATASETLV